MNTKDKLYSQVTIGKKKVDVYYNPELVNYMGIILGAAMFTGRKHVIMVDDYYMRADDNVKQFILQHECGHIHNKDLSKGFIKQMYKQLVQIGGGITQADYIIENRTENIEREYNADMYALHVCGKDIAEKGLGYIWGLTQTEEIEERLRRIGSSLPNNASMWSYVDIDTMHSISLEEIEYLD